MSCGGECRVTSLEDNENAESSNRNGAVQRVPAGRKESATLTHERFPQMRAESLRRLRCLPLAWPIADAAAAS